MVASMYKSPLFGGSTLGDFSHPYFSYPRKNITFGLFYPRTFFFAPGWIKCIRIETHAAKTCIFATFFCNYSAVLTRFLGPRKTCATEEAVEEEPACAFNCSSVGYSAQLSSAATAQGPSSPGFSVLEKADFLGSGRSTLGDFSHPPLSYPWKNTISGEFCPRTFFLHRQ